MKNSPADETLELIQIYVRRGLTASLARQVAEQLMAKDALSAHARDELGFADHAGAKPILAAFASAISFSLGAAMPTLAAFVTPRESVVAAVSVATLIFLAVLGALGAWMGGAHILKPTLRVGFWGALAMAVTAGIGMLIGKAV